MRNSATARLVVMMLLTSALLIPIAWVQVIVSERAGRRDVAAAEIGTTWGGPQLVAGPVLAVPYEYTWPDSSGRRST